MSADKKGQSEHISALRAAEGCHDGCFSSAPTSGKDGLGTGIPDNCRFFCSRLRCLLSRCFVFVMTQPLRPPSVVDNSVESLKVMNVRMWKKG